MLVAASVKLGVIVADPICPRDTIASPGERQVRVCPRARTPALLLCLRRCVRGTFLVAVADEFFNLASGTRLIVERKFC